MFCFFTCCQMSRELRIFVTMQSLPQLPPFQIFLLDKHRQREEKEQQSLFKPIQGWSFSFTWNNCGSCCFSSSPSFPSTVHLLCSVSWHKYEIPSDETGQKAFSKVMFMHYTLFIHFIFNIPDSLNVAQPQILL